MATTIAPQFLVQCAGNFLCVATQMIHHDTSNIQVWSEFIRGPTHQHAPQLGGAFSNDGKVPSEWLAPFRSMRSVACVDPPILGPVVFFQVIVELCQVLAKPLTCFLVFRAFRIEIVSVDRVDPDPPAIVPSFDGHVPVKSPGRKISGSRIHQANGKRILAGSQIRRDPLVELRKVHLQVVVFVEKELRRDRSTV